MKDKEKQLVNEIKQDFKMHEEKHKQIEEMANFIHRTEFVDISRYEEETIAKELLKHYQPKLPEDSVVLTREEFDELGLVVETVQEYESDEKGQPLLVKERKIVKKLRTDFTELLNQEIRELQLAQERKETAEKILDQIKFLVEERNGADLEDLSVDGTILEEILVELAKQFGVEIKE